MTRRDSQTTIRIGTRGSSLALWQADHVAALLKQAHGGLQTERVTFKTTGDHVLDRPLAEIGGKGLFTKELEVGLEAGDIDIAVHSLKDMPTTLPTGMVLGAIPERGDPRDCLVTRAGERPEAPAHVGTASLRRACLALRRWPEAHVEPIRGNVQTRVGRLHEEPPRRMDVVILAYAGLQRVKMTEERTDVDFTPLDPEGWIPAVSQGALAIECRAEDARIRDLLAAIHHEETARCVTAERAFLRAVEGDCRVPVGALAVSEGSWLRLRAFIGSPGGEEYLEYAAAGPDPATLGVEVAHHLLEAGGREILAELKAAQP